MSLHPGSDGPMPPPRNIPAVGEVYPIPTPAGTRLYKVVKATPVRIALRPLSAAQEQRVLAYVQERGRAVKAETAAARPWWKRWRR